MLPYAFTTSSLIRALRRPYKIVQAFVACCVFRFPSRKLRVVGVTGTTGKTTCIHLTTVALESAGYTVGAISSIHVQIGTKVLTNLTGLTSLGPWQLQKLLAEMVASGCHYAVLEVSSHALDQGRLWGTRFDVAVLTNMGRDHLDYHHTMEDYIAAKNRLFFLVSSRPRKRLKGTYVPRVFVIPLDDPRAQEFLKRPADHVYGVTLLNPATPSGVEPVYAYGIQVQAEKTMAVAMVNGTNALLHLRLAGWFNVRNALTAVAVGFSQGIPLARMTRELYEVRSIPGRFERVDAGQPFTILIDYAVTAVALESLYGALQGMHPKRIIAIFGACGDRDRGKRAEMASIVGSHAHVVFLTNEDPFGEDPEQIFADLEAGFPSVPCIRTHLHTLSADAHTHPHVYVKIPDRREAIRAAIAFAKSGDIVVATGKGAETAMRFKDHAVPWNERQVFEEEVQKKYGTHSSH